MRIYMRSVCKIIENVQADLNNVVIFILTFYGFIFI